MTKILATAIGIVGAVVILNTDLANPLRTILLVLSVLVFGLGVIMLLSEQGGAK